MAGFLKKFNTDNVFLRSLIVSLLRALNDKITYLQTNDKEQIMEIYIPFYYSMTGDEPFLQDSFIQYQNCLDGSTFAEGNYDVIPRGIITLASVQINQEALTNKFTRASYTQEDLEGQIKTMSAYTNFIPLIFSFNVEMKVDTVLDAFKIFESVLGLYKAHNFYFNHGGILINSRFGLSETYNLEKSFEFTYGSSPEYVGFSFSLDIESYYPDKDLTTERFRGNLMQGGIRAIQTIPEESISQEDRKLL